MDAGSTEKLAVLPYEAEIAVRGRAGLTSRFMRRASSTAPELSPQRYLLAAAISTID